MAPRKVPNENPDEGLGKREVHRSARIEGSRAGRGELPDARATSAALFLFTIRYADLSTMLRISTGPGSVEKQAPFFFHSRRPRKKSRGVEAANEIATSFESHRNASDFLLVSFDG